MSTPLSETVIEHRKEVARSFKADNTPGDWRTFPVAFLRPFVNDEVRVVAMASSYGVNAGAATVPAVPVITAVNHNGFTIQARKSDCIEGSAGMEWIAVLERPGLRSSVQVDIRTGVLQHKHFAPDCTHGDWNSWAYAFGNPMPSMPIVVGTPIRHRGDLDFSADFFGLPPGEIFV